MSNETDQLHGDVEMGQTVYDESGDPLGTVRGIDDDGFYVLAPEGAPQQTMAEMRAVTGREYVMWRCWQCGEMGRIEAALPDACPDCGASKEELYYWIED